MQDIPTPHSYISYPAMHSGRFEHHIWHWDIQVGRSRCLVRALAASTKEAAGSDVYKQLVVGVDRGWLLGSLPTTSELRKALGYV